MCVSGAFDGNTRRSCASRARFVRRATKARSARARAGRRVVAAAQPVRVRGRLLRGVPGTRHLARGAPERVLYLLRSRRRSRSCHCSRCSSSARSSRRRSSRRAGGAEARGKKACAWPFLRRRRQSPGGPGASTPDSMTKTLGRVGGDARGGGMRGGVEAGRGRSDLPGTKAFPNRVEPKSPCSDGPRRAPRRLRRRRRARRGGDRGGARAFLPKRSRRRAEAARRIREESAFGAVRREQPRGPLAERARDEESVTL